MHIKTGFKHVSPSKSSFNIVKQLLPSYEENIKLRTIEKLFSLGEATTFELITFDITLL